MATAVIRIHLSDGQAISDPDYRAGIDSLLAEGYEIIAPGSTLPPDGRREVAILSEEDSAEHLDTLRARCESVFGRTAELGVVTYVSRGTDDDALGVLRRFGIPGEVRRDHDSDEETVTVRIAGSATRQVPESHLHTALEAALNCRVRVVLT